MEEGEGARVGFSTGDVDLFWGGPQVGQSYLSEIPSYSQSKMCLSLEFFHWDPGFIVLAVFSGPNHRSPQGSSLKLFGGIGGFHPLTWRGRVQPVLSMPHTSLLALTTAHQKLLTLNTCNFLPEGFFFFSWWQEHIWSTYQASQSARELRPPEATLNQ